ncbi:MAG: hypothetical protein ACYC61_09065 [Isosphaeraceae bacterium]
MPSGRRNLVASILASLALLALGAACFGRLLASPSALIVDGRRPSIDFANRGDPRPVGNDLVFLFLPHHESIARRIAEFGHRPVWDARGFAGRPLPGNPQAGMSYPPAWIAWGTRTPAVLGWITVAHLLWAGAGAYRLLRSLGVSRWAATVGAGVYQASPYLMAHTFEGHYPHVWAACWYPWAFWAFRQARSGRSGGLLLAPILALVYLTGHPQEWLMLVLALCAWSALDALHAGKAGESRRAAAELAAWAGVLVLSVGLAAVDVVPQWLARPWLIRNHDPGLEVGIPRRYHLGGLNAFQLLSPSALGGPADYLGDDNYWETLCSLGLAPLVLVAVGTFRHPDRRLARGWAALAGLAVLFACGRAGGLYPVCYTFVPGMSAFRVPSRSLFLANLAGAVLAGLGMETLLSRMGQRGSWRRFAPTMFVVSALLLSLLWFVRIPVHSDVSRQTRPIAVSPIAPSRPPSEGRAAMAASRVLGDRGFQLALGGGMTLAIAAMFPIGTRRRRIIVGLLGVVALAELGWRGFSLLQVAPASQFTGVDPISAEILRLGSVSDAGAVGRSSPKPPVRIKARDAFYGDLPAAIHGIEKTNVDDAFQLDRAAALYETLYPIASHVRPMTERLMSPGTKEHWKHIRRAVLDRMSVACLVSDRVETEPAWPVVGEGELAGRRFVIQRNPTALPRAYVVPSAKVLPDDRAVVLASLAAVDPRKSVIMTAEPFDGLAPTPRQPFTPAGWISVDPDRPIFRVTTEAPGLLVVADSWMPGWTATVDGRPAPVLVGNHSQRVVPLPDPGPHVIAMEYHPPGLMLGGALSIVSALAWSILALHRAMRAARSRPGIPAGARHWRHPRNSLIGAEQPQPGSQSI